MERIQKAEIATMSMSLREARKNKRAENRRSRRSR
jgi:hypothetical protein